MIGTDEQVQRSTAESDGFTHRRALPDAAHVGAVHLQVADLDRSVTYYTAVLGLGVLHRDGGSARLGVRGTGRLLVVLHEKAGVAPVPRAGRFGLYHFAVLLPDRAALGRFAAHLFGRGLRPDMADHAVSEALYLSDPDGLGIEVYADRPRDTWRCRDDELVIVTEPLDISAVIAAGEGREWGGVPDGTVMGHVHLHVGDLGRADQFYSETVGFAKTVWSYPGALFFSAGGYHHHVATNAWSPGPSPGPHEARLIEWDLVLPARDAAEAVAQQVAIAGHPIAESRDGWRTADPWGTGLHICA